MLFATEALFKQHFPKVKLCVLGHPPPAMKRMFGKTFAQLPYGRTLLYKLHFRKMKKTVDKANALILGSGGFLYDSASRTVEKDLRLILHAQEKHEPTMIYAVGVTSLRHEKSKQLVRQAINNANYVSCRDPASANRIKSLSVNAFVHATADPAIIAPKILGFRPKEKQFPNNPKICVSLRNRFVSFQLFKTLSKLLKVLVERYNAKIVLVPLRATWFDDDRIPLKQLFKQLESVKHNISFFERRPSVEQFTRMMEDMSVVIGMKLHSVIFATSMGVPTIALSYKQDVTDFMSYVKQEQYAISLTQACNFAYMLGKMENLIDSYSSVSRQLLANVEIISKKIAFDIKGVESLLEAC